MKLEELKKKLYKPGPESEAEFEERLGEPKPYQPDQEKDKDFSEEWPAMAKKGLSVRLIKYLLVGSVLIGVIFLIIAGFMFWRGLTSFDKNEVKLEISGPERVVSGEEINYTVSYQNKTRLALNEIKLVFYYPEGSIPRDQKDLVQTFDLPALEAGQENQVELPVKVIGLKGEIKNVWTELSYQPGKLTSRFINQAKFLTSVISVPLILDFDLPERLVSGQSFDFSIKYFNQGEVSFNNLQLRLEYPIGFSFQSAEPQPLEEDKVWYLTNLMAGQEGRVFIRGNIQGEEGEAKLFKAQLGLLKDGEFIPYAETVNAFQVSLSPLFVSQTVNQATDYIAQSGETLIYQISYKNTTNVGIRNVVIISKLEGNALDLTSLKLEEGSFNGGDQTITWKTSNLPALEFLGAHQQGQVRFSVKVKDPLPIRNFADKNFTVTNTAKIDSPQAPLSLGDIQVSGQSQLISKIVSQLTLQAQGYYNDDLIPNSGPIPPRVGQTTTYTIKWRLINTANDLAKVKVEAYLPPHVRWLGKINPVNADLKYNPQTGQVIWQVGDLPAATGLLLPVRRAAFQIAITPGLAHLGNLVELIGQSTASGQDNFTGSDLKSVSQAIDTDLPDDPAIERREGTVIE